VTLSIGKSQVSCDPKKCGIGYFKSYQSHSQRCGAMECPCCSHSGCVAKTYKGETIGIVCIPLSSNSQDCFDKFHLRDNIPLLDSFDLSFSNHIHRFDSAQRSSCTVERLQSHHQFYNSLNVSMILLNHIIQMFALP
jgi:hypothetical protein